jgi:hypothetical protein
VRNVIMLRILPFVRVVVEILIVSWEALPLDRITVFEPQLQLTRKSQHSNWHLQIFDQVIPRLLFGIKRKRHIEALQFSLLHM